MKRQRAEMKAELMSEAEGVIDELLEWGETAAVPTLDDIETVVLKLRQRLSSRMAEVVVNGQAAAQPGLGPPCPHCQREMHGKGLKTTWVETRAGRVQVRRMYYYCEQCDAGGFFPSGPATTEGGPDLE